MLLKLVGTTPEAFEKFAFNLAKEHGVDPSTTHLIRLNDKTRDGIETLMRKLGLITANNERDVLADIGNLGLP